jgi:hypothetical protein
VARTNLCPNPSLANNATGWFGPGGWARVTGLTGFTRTTGWAGTAAGDPIGARGAVTGSAPYTYSAYVRAQNAGDVEAQINWYNSLGNYVSTSTPQTFTLTANTVTRIWTTATAPPTAVTAGLVVFTATSLGQLVWTQTLYEAGSILAPWFDGSSAGASWTGTAGNSTSTIPDDAALTGSDPFALTELGELTALPLGVDTHTLTDTGAVVSSFTGADSATLGESAALAKFVVAAIDPGVTVVEGIAAGVSKVVDLAGDAGDDVIVEGLAVTVSKVVDLDPGVVVVEGPALFAGNTRPDPADLIVEGLPVDVGKAGQAGPDSAVRPRALAAPRARMIARRILDGEWLSWDLPVTDPEVTWNLSAAVEIAGVFKPEIRHVADLGLEPWGTWIYLEEDGVIRAGGIMLPTVISRDGVLRLSAAGPLYYARKVPWRGQFSGVEVDPAAMVAMMWTHIQSFPRGDLGVTVHGTTPIRIGTEARDVEFVTGEGEVVEFEAGPYKLNWWDNTIIGSEIDQLAGETPFDVTESCAWTDATRTDVAHRIDLAYPQVGTRRHDLRFVQGENLIEWAPVEEPSDAYADTVYMRGKGEGPDAVTAEATWWVGNRLRLPALVDDKTVDNSQRAKAIAQEELAARLAALIEIPEIVVDTRHRNAPIGSFAAGDEILPRVTYPYVGEVKQWHRITSVRYLPRQNRAVLSLTRRSEFRA